MATEGDSLLRERLAALEPRPWHASGSFDPPAAPTLTFASAEGQRVTLALGAGRADAELAPLLAAASPSPFAKVGKTVVDKQVRDAAELLPPSFESSVALPPKGVLAEAAAVLAPDATNVCAELLKLNIYGPGGKFQAHRDTPFGRSHFGSLVVALPWSHGGGALAMRQGGRQAAWEPARGVQGQRLQWCAFPPDVEHEVLPVTSGYRLTFSYNLYSAAAPPAPSAGNKRARSAPRALPLVSAAVAAERPPVPALDGEREAPQVVAALRGLLADPGWHTGGATLGCVLGYKYAAGLEGLTDAMFPACLKGRDRLLYAAIAAAGLQVSVRPIFRGWEDPEAAGYDPYYEARDVQWPEERGGDEEGVPGRADWYLQQVAVGESFEAARRGMTTESDDWGDVFAGGEGPGPNLYSDDWGAEEFNRGLKARPAKELGIVWVTPLDEQKAFLQADKVAATGNGSLYYMNFYSGAALLITVPPAGEGGRPAAAPAGPSEV